MYEIVWDPETGGILLQETGAVGLRPRSAMTFPISCANGGEYKKSGFKNTPGIEANSLLPAGSEEVRCWWTTIKSIGDNDYNLAAGRYKPQLAEQAPKKDPIVLIREVLAIEREIAIGLEKLLQELEEH